MNVHPIAKFLFNKQSKYLERGSKPHWRRHDKNLLQASWITTLHAKYQFIHIKFMYINTEITQHHDAICYQLNVARLLECCYFLVQSSKWATKNMNWFIWLNWLIWIQRNFQHKAGYIMASNLLQFKNNEINEKDENFMRSEYEK